MKTLAMMLGLSFFAGQEPSGCSATAGSNVANAPDGGSTVVDRDTSCAGGPHTFCDDFAGALPSKFDGEELMSGALKLDSERALSAPSSLLATTTRITQGNRSLARLKKDFPQSGRRFTLAWSEWIDSACIANGDSVESAVIGLRQNSYWIAVRHGRDSDSIVEAGVANASIAQAHVLRDKLPRDTWARIVLEVDLEKSTIALTHGNLRVVENEPLKQPPGGSHAPRIQVGILNDNLFAPPSACSVGIDDVVFDIVE